MEVEWKAIMKSVTKKIKNKLRFIFAKYYLCNNIYTTSAETCSEALRFVVG